MKRTSWDGCDHDKELADAVGGLAIGRSLTIAVNDVDDEYDASVTAPRYLPPSHNYAALYEATVSCMARALPENAKESDVASIATLLSSTVLAAKAGVTSAKGSHSKPKLKSKSARRRDRRNERKVARKATKASTLRSCCTAEKRRKREERKLRRSKRSRHVARRVRQKKDLAAIRSSLATLKCA